MRKHLVTLSDETWENASDLAEESDMSISDVIETILADEFDNQEDHIDDLFGEAIKEEEEESE